MDMQVYLQGERKDDRDRDRHIRDLHEYPGEPLEARRAVLPLPFEQRVGEHVISNLGDAFRCLLKRGDEEFRLVFNALLRVCEFVSEIDEDAELLLGGSASIASLSRRQRAFCLFVRLSFAPKHIDFILRHVVRQALVLVTPFPRPPQEQIHLESVRRARRLQQSLEVRILRC